MPRPPLWDQKEQTRSRTKAPLEALGRERGVVGLVLLTAYSFNLDGGICLYLAIASMLLAQATNTPLDIWHQIALLPIPRAAGDDMTIMR